MEVQSFSFAFSFLFTKITLECSVRDALANGQPVKLEIVSDYRKS